MEQKNFRVHFAPPLGNTSKLLSFSHQVVPDSLRSHGLQHARIPCPSQSPRVCSNSCPLSQWCHPTTLSSAALFSFCLQSFLVSGSFPMSWLFGSDGQSVGASASASVLPVNIQDWFPLGKFFFFAVQGTLKSLLQHHSLKASILWCSAIFMVLSSHLYMTSGSVWARWFHLLLLGAYFFSIGSCPDLHVLILFNWIIKEPWPSHKLFLELFAFWLNVLQTLSIHPPWIFFSFIPLTHKS